MNIPKYMYLFFWKEYNYKNKIRKKEERITQSEFFFSTKNKYISKL